MRYEGEEFVGREVEMDGQQFVGCEFQRCVLAFTGEPNSLGDRGLMLVGSHLEESTWDFRGAAAMTMCLLRELYHSGPGGRATVEGLFRDIRHYQPSTEEA